MPISYKYIQELREVIIEEMRTSFTTLTVEHLKLAEMRLQTVLQSKVDLEDIKFEIRINGKRTKAKNTINQNLND